MGLKDADFAVVQGNSIAVIVSIRNSEQGNKMGYTKENHIDTILRNVLALRTHRPSIRQKIAVGYYGIVPIIITLSIFSFMELRFFEKKILFGKTIAEFCNATLEVRRFEKNFFLYKQ